MVRFRFLVTSAETLPWREQLPGTATPARARANHGARAGAGAARRFCGHGGFCQRQSAGKSPCKGLPAPRAAGPPAHQHRLFSILLMISNRNSQQRTRGAEGRSRAVAQDTQGCRGRGGSAQRRPQAPLRGHGAGCHPPEQPGRCSQRWAQGDAGSTRLRAACASTGSRCLEQEQPGKSPRVPPAAAINTRQPTAPPAAAARASPAKPGALWVPC